MSEVNKGNKISWLSILQGWGMLLVVIGHAELAQNGNIEWVDIIYRAIYSFHMPLFVFISGYLFYLTRISRCKDYGSVVKDKLLRLGIPLVCFTILGLAAKMLAASLVKNPVEFNGFIDILWMLIGVKQNAMGAMWFINIILLYMLLYPLYVWILKNKFVTAVWLCLLVVVHYLAPADIDILYTTKALKMWIFFACGIVVARYGFDRYVSAGLPTFVLSLLLFVAMFVMGIQGFPIAVVGIVGSITLSKYLEKIVPGIFASFRDYTYPIYLMSVFPQMAVEMIYRKLGCPFFVPFFIASIWVGIYFPMMIVWIVRKINSKWLKVAIGM